MPIFACGINHKTAPVGVRERLSIVPDDLSASLRDLFAQTRLEEVAILSTCNRTEFYYESEHHEPVLAWLSQRHRCRHDDLMPYIYIHQEEAAIRHIMRVASGLDSMILGEPQILGQMKTAFAAADSAGTLGPQLRRLFQYIFSVTKEIRTSTGIAANPVSVAYAAVDLANHIFSDLSNTSVMMLGAGETAELTIRYLREQPIQQLFIVNRTFAKAQALADKYQGQAAGFEKIADLLSQADIVISAVNSAIPVLGKGTVERALKTRRRRPVFMVDLAVPRNIEPEAGEIPDVYLFCIDDLQQVIENNLQNRREAAEEAERLIDLQVEHYMRWLQSLDVVDTIRRFRGKVEAVRDQEIRNAQMLLQQGMSPEAVVCVLARNLANKFMHSPTIQLRQAGYEQDLETLAVARRLLDLDH